MGFSTRWTPKPREQHQLSSSLVRARFEFRLTLNPFANTETTAVELLTGKVQNLPVDFWKRAFQYAISNNLARFDAAIVSYGGTILTL
jgi:hypothetical protein